MKELRKKEPKVFVKTTTIRASAREEIVLDDELEKAVEEVTKCRDLEPTSIVEEGFLIYRVSWNKKTNKPCIEMLFPIAEYEPKGKS